MGGVDSKAQIEQKALAGSDEPGALQQTERAGKFAQQELLCKGTCQNEGDDSEGQYVQAVDETR